MFEAAQRAAISVVLVSHLISGCGHSLSSASPTGDPAARGRAAVRVPEAWISDFQQGDDVDSVAVYPGGSVVFATTKATHQVLVLDAANGELRTRFGGPGSELGRFSRPNGIAVAGNLLLVVERDNHRVQAFQLPELVPVGVLGAEELQRPYGIAAALSAHGTVDLWVTDNFDRARATIEPDPRLAERVRHWRLAVTSGNEFAAELVASIGETEGRGALHKVETIGFDPERELLLVADETPERMGLVVYTADGDFTGRVVGAEIFQAEPEGVALWSCGNDGFWIATDQHKALSVFHVFDRRSFGHIGAFAGAVTANTDGVGITTEALPGFPRGAFFAVHDDGAVAAFDLEKVAAALGVDCR